jgi:cytochrome c-type biogenesis protein CcmE
VRRKGNPARLVIALSVAAVLAVFLIYTSLAGGTPSIQPSSLPGHTGRVTLVGVVVGPVRGDGYAQALRFTLRDRNGTARVPVVYRGEVPDLFKVGREIVIDGKLVNGTFAAIPGTLVTKCPSKYASAKKTA